MGMLIQQVTEMSTCRIRPRKSSTTLSLPHAKAYLTQAWVAWLFRTFVENRATLYSFKMPVGVYAIDALRRSFLAEARDSDEQK